MFKDEITDQDILDQCKTFRDSLRMSWRRSGKTIEQISIELLPREASLQDVTNMVKNLSRIINPKSPEDKRNLDGDMLIPFMVATGNSIPLRWYFLKYAPQLSCEVSNETIMEKLDSLEGLFHTTLRNIHQAARRARSKGLSTARMSVSDQISIDVPEWLLLDVNAMSPEFING